MTAFLFRAPRSFAYAWSRDGAALEGAATSSLTATEPGAYSCQVTATNQAGSTTQTSAPHSLAAAPAPALPAPGFPAPALPAPAAAAFGAGTLVALELAADGIAAGGPLQVRVANGRERKLSLRLTAKLTDPAGNTRTVTKRVTPKLKRKRGG